MLFAFFFFNDFIYGCAGSSCCVGFSLAAASRGCSPVVGGRAVAACGLLTAVAPLVAEHGLWCPQTPVLQLLGSRAPAQWL